jgi:hypothetical protein
VGQNIPFSLTALPDGVSATNSQWTLGGTYVNEKIPAPNANSSDDYIDDSDLLKNIFITNCWWVSGGDPYKEYNANLECDLTFTNGNALEHANIAGKFWMTKPNIVWLGIVSGSVAVDTNYNQPGIWLHFGNPSTIPGMTFFFLASIHNWSLGTYSEIQLVDLNNITHCQLNGQSIHQSGVGLDGVLGSTNFADSFSHSTIYFDSPGEPCRSGDSQVSDSSSYRTFLMFQPSGSGGISVPLKLIGWNWSGIAEFNTNNNSWTGTGTAPAPSPNGTDTTQFPVWTNVLGPWPNGYNFITNNSCN